MILGFFLLGVAVIALLVGFVQKRKMKGIVNAPFKKTGDIASNPQAGDAAGTISCEGAVVATEPLTAPCSGRSCIYYEIEVKQMWEKHVSTENGTKKQTGKSNAHEEKRGSIFHLDDGSGPVKVNAMEKVDGQLETSFEETSTRGYGEIHYGQWHTHIRAIHDDSKYAVGTICTEKIIPAEGNLFVKGKLEGGQITKTGGLLGKLLLSTHGRDALVGATKRNMMIGFIVGGALLPVGGGMAVFADPPGPTVEHCVDIQGASNVLVTEDGRVVVLAFGGEAAHSAVGTPLSQTCEGRVHDEEPVELTWAVSEAGAYTFSAMGSGTDPDTALWPHVIVRNSSGLIVLEMSAPDGSAPDGSAISGTAGFEPGTYTIEVNDTHNLSIYDASSDERVR